MNIASSLHSCTLSHINPSLSLSSPHISSLPYHSLSDFLFFLIFLILTPTLPISLFLEQGAISFSLPGLVIYNNSPKKPKFNPGNRSKVCFSLPKIESILARYLRFQRVRQEKINKQNLYYFLKNIIQNKK